RHGLCAVCHHAEPMARLRLFIRRRWLCGPPAFPIASTTSIPQPAGCPRGHVATVNLYGPVLVVGLRHLYQRYSCSTFTCSRIPIYRNLRGIELWRGLHCQQLPFLLYAAAAAAGATPNGQPALPAFPP